jgi:hypothetical protein
LNNLVTTLNGYANTTGVNTTNLQGLLPNTIVSFSFSHGTPYAFSITRSITRISLAIKTMRRPGLVSMSVSVGGNSKTLLDSQYVGFYSGSDLYYTDDEPIPAGATIMVSTQGGDYDGLVQY